MTQISFNIHKAFFKREVKLSLVYKHTYSIPPAAFFETIDTLFTGEELP